MNHFNRVRPSDISRSVPSHREIMSSRINEIPHWGFLLMKDGSEVSFNLAETPNFPYTFDCYHDVVALFMYLPRFNEWAASWWTLDGSCPRHQSADVADELISVVIHEQEDEIDRINRIENDPLFALEDAMKRHDWYYHFSDDHRVWSSGEGNAKRIGKLSRSVPKKEFDRLMEKYCPYSSTIEEGA